MFKHGKTRILASIAVAAIFAVIAVTAIGSSPPAVSVKLTPSMVSLDTSSLAPKLAQADLEAVWRLLDRDTDTSYMPLGTARVTVSLPEVRTVNTIRVYGASSYQLNLYRDNNGAWEHVPSLTGIDLTGLDAAAWNTLAVSDSFSTSQLLFEFVPQGNVSTGLREIEIWGPDTSSADKSGSYLTLDNIRTPQDMLDILAKSPSHIMEFSAAPSELSVTEGAAPSVSIGLTQNPVLFKRAYILYDGYNLVRAVSIQRRINGLSWSGGFALPQAEGASPSWSSYLEEINPAWLIQGENKIEFRTASGAATIRGLRLVIETDSGWNLVSSVTPTALSDGNASTSYTITASPTTPSIQVNFERPVQPETVRLNVSGPMNLTAGLQYQSAGLWKDLKTGWQIDLSALQTGWNDITLPAPVSTQALRLVLNTNTLRLKSGVRVGEINEIQVSASAAGPFPADPRIVISYPRDGEYFGRTAYIQGFATPGLDKPGNAAWTSIEGKEARNVADGSFSVSLTKDETHFYDQPDDEAWQPVARSTYGGQIGAMQIVLLNRNSGSATGVSPDNESRKNAPFTDKRDHHTETVAPNQPKKIQYKGVTLDIPAGAVDQNTDITIVPLNEADLAHYDPGMINVTYPAAGYRFLPHGIKFKKAITVSFGYSKQLLVAGQTENDVNMYYYDETLLRWQQLTRVKVDAAALQLSSLSDHFTDIINSTLVVPEHPQALSFNPNSIKDIKAADPSANVNLIEPPKANNKGTASLSYPIEVPPGRNKLQPNLAIQYNSSGGNGWMGMGWDLPMPAITIDTRWGAARYTPDKESDTYLLDGEQLSPIAHRGALVARTSEKVFHTRVEGQFRKIIRHGSSPATYWWEVIDKNGTRYLYGGTNGPASDSTLATSGGNIFLWALREVRDRNDNFIRYHCARAYDSGAGSALGVNLYVEKITYTGHGTSEGPYSVTLQRESGRTDKQTDGRGGFKRVVGDVLRKVDVSLGTQLIRRYEFRYNQRPYGDDRGPAFYKTLLTSLIQYGTDGTTIFNKHDFTYYDEARNAGGAYYGFVEDQSWPIGDDIGESLMGYGDASAIGGNTGDSTGYHFYIGIGTGTETTSKSNSVGLKIGSSDGESEGVVTLADMDGDGLPDKVLRGSYRKNLSGPHGTGPGFSGPIGMSNMPGISHESVSSMTTGIESYYGIVIMGDKNESETETDMYLTDVNGDGLTDAVQGGSVLFNHLENKIPTFGSNSAVTPVPIGKSELYTPGLLPDRTAQEAEREKKFPLLDTVRRWVAPYDGTVSINAPVQLIEDSSTEWTQYNRADGVRVAIQLEGGELWSSVIGTIDYGRHDPTNVTSVPVKRGDNLYFRLQSVYNGRYDQVTWDPGITYQGVDTARNDVNDLPEYVYQASREFTLAGRQSTVTVPVDGTLHLAGTLEKKGVTTDNVKMSITLNGDEVYSDSFGYADQNKTFTLSKSIDVKAKDVLSWKVLVDSPIDASQIIFKPNAYYTAATGITRLIDENGKYIMQINPPYEMDLYPVNSLTAPQEYLLSAKTGTLVVQPSLSATAGVTTPTEVAFTAKRKDTLLGKGIITIDRDADGYLVISPVSLSIAVNKDDRIFFDFSTRDVNLAKFVSTGVSVAYQDNIPQDYFSVPSAFHSAMTDNAFPVPFRGWGVTGYNGNSPRDTQPIEQSSLVIDSSYTTENARVYPFAPQPDKDSWGGVDESAWATAGKASSSRLGPDDIRMHHSEDYAGAIAPSRLSESESTCLGGSSVSGSKGKSESRVDFQDMNGDAYPDVIGNAGIQYTAATGELSGGLGGGAGSARKSENESANVSIGSGGGGNMDVATGNGKGNVTPGGQSGAATGKQTQDMPKLGMSVNAGGGTSDTDHDLIDINGDGLPDMVTRGGGIMLNLGYSFLGDAGGFGDINAGNTENGGVSMSYNSNNYSLAGGLNIGLDKATSSETYVDINGDGLMDKIYGSTVMLNTGSSYVPITWPGMDGDSARDKHISMGGGVYFTFGWSFYGIKIVFNIGANYSSNMGRPEIAYRDMDGDGHTDLVTSSNDGEIHVRRGIIGRTNLLQTVKRPLGGSITLKYERDGNTYEMPQSQWNMTLATVTDGRGNWYVTKYTYQNGYKDRYERDFYGYETVTETHAPGKPIERTIVETFNNRDFYLKGLVQKSVTKDKETTGHIWARTVNTYTLTPVQGYDYTEFPALTKTDTYFYDGNDLSSATEDGFKKNTYQTFAYDSFGNVTNFFNAGEVFTAADDAMANIIYYNDPANYIIKPKDIKVYGSANNKTLRWRESAYDSATGNMTKLTLHNTGTPSSVWNMTYDGYGNIQTIADPVGYVLGYTYDQTTYTYVSRIADNFTAANGGPYYSTASYNLLFGQMEKSVDLNMHVEARGYDMFGRFICVYGPYDTAPADPNTCTSSPTIAFGYTAPTFGSDEETLSAPAHAVTYNKAVSVKGSSPLVIKTLTYVDGMKRILQTKKDADVKGVYGLTISGLTVFDELGRVTAQGQPVFDAGYTEAFSNLLEARNPTRFTYDNLDRTIVVQSPDDSALPDHYATTKTYYTFGQVNNSGNIYAKTIVVDPEGNKSAANRRGTKESYKDVDDRIVAVVEYNNGAPITSIYDYDPLGQITTVIDNKANTTTVAYDQVGNRVQISNPDTGITNYGYDQNRNLTSKQNANNLNIAYKYVFNRLTDIKYPQSTTVHYDYGAMNEAYNRAGRIKHVSDESGDEWRYYGKLGETTREEKMVNAHTPAVQKKKYTTDYVFDSFGRMVDMTYPDGEQLHYSYDNGGLLKAAWGEKEGNRYNYINSLFYDEFSQRTHISYGNGVKTTYTYNDKTRRLATLHTALADGRYVQKLNYAYDLVGNVMNLENGIAVPTNTALPSGPVSQSFGYDDLYQITSAKGESSFGPGKQNNYASAFIYDTIGNMVQKNQVNQIIQPSTTSILPKRTNYVLNYAYGTNQPHAVIDDGAKTYSYDPAGNMTGWKSKTSGQKRTISWNEENRIKEIDDNGKATYFLYDNAGERVVKRGQYGESIYINRFYAIKNGELGTKHIFAGETRVLSKLVKTPPTTTANTNTTPSIPGSNGLNHGKGKKLGIIKRLPDGTQTTVIVQPIEKDEFYYHGDHLGSSNMITDTYGDVYQHLEYFPYGEEWIEEGGSHGGNVPGYKFTGKELDPETGLYYYGARYYDPVLSKWISADPILAKYLPTGDNEKDKNLSGMGGVYNSANLGLYNYAHLNPVRYKDPDGNETVGQLIDRNAMAAASQDKPIQTYGWAFAATFWDTFGAENVSTITDKGMGGLTAGVFVGAVLETATLGKGKAAVEGVELTTKTASKLGKNLVESKALRPIGAAAHHIVAKGAAVAAELRNKLKLAKININDAANGIWVDAEKHASMHTKEYYQKIESFFKNAKTPEKIEQALKEAKAWVKSITE